MSTGIQIGVKGLADAVRAMERRAQGVRGGTQTALRQALTDVQRDIWTGFAESRQVGGQTWLALSPRYAAWKRKHGYSPKPNIKTGALRQYWSITVSGTRGVLRSTATDKKGKPYARHVNEVRPIVPTENSIRARAKAAFERLLQKVLA